MDVKVTREKIIDKVGQALLPNGISDQECEEYIDGILEGYNKQITLLKHNLTEAVKILDSVDKNNVTLLDYEKELVKEIKELLDIT